MPEFNRVSFPLLFQNEASDVWILMQRCHWYIWIFLTFVLVFVLVIFFLIVVDVHSNLKYTASKEALLQRFVYLKFARVTHISKIEFIWTTLPCFFLLFIGIRSIYTLYLIDSACQVYFVVRALGKQWFWQYEIVENHPSFELGLMNPFSNLINDSQLEENFFELNEKQQGVQKIINTTQFFDSYMLALNEIDPLADDRRNLKVDTALSLVVGLPVRFLTTAMDVLHSFALPSFGLKLDAVPGRLNAADVVVERHGIFYGQCSELCGQGHAFMPIAVYVQRV